MRIRLFSFLAVLGLLFLASNATAADCTAISSRTAGSYTIETLFLLDSDTANATGTSCDLNTFGSPDFARVSVQAATGCETKYSIQIDGQDGSTTLSTKIGLLSNSKRSLRIDAPIHRFMRAVSQNLSGCTDLDIIVELWISNQGNAPVANLTQSLVFCGVGTSGDGTIYLSPADGPFAGDGTAHEIGETECDLLDETVEATGDEILFTDLAYGVNAFWCTHNGTLAADETYIYTLRSDIANTVPVQSCTIAEAETDCSMHLPTTTDIVGGGTIVMKVVQDGNNVNDDHWCRALLTVR